LNKLKQVLKEHYSMLDVSIKQGEGHNINSQNYLVTSNDKKYYLKAQDIKATKIKQIEAMDICYQYDMLVPEIIKTTENSLFITKGNILFFLTKFYDGTFCSFNSKEIYSAGEQLTILNNRLKSTHIVLERTRLYDNLTEEQLNDIKQQTDDKKVLMLCDKLPLLYNMFQVETNNQLVHLDYNLQNVLFKNNKVQVILDYGSIFTSSLTQSIAFGCDRFSKSKADMLIFLRGAITQGFSEEQIALIPSYIIKEAVYRINYILRTNTWSFDIDKHLDIIKNVEKLEWI